MPVLGGCPTTYVPWHFGFQADFKTAYLVASCFGNGLNLEILSTIGCFLAHWNDGLLEITSKWPYDSMITASFFR